MWWIRIRCQPFEDIANALIEPVYILVLLIVAHHLNAHIREIPHQPIAYGKTATTEIVRICIECTIKRWWCQSTRTYHQRPKARPDGENRRNVIITSSQQSFDELQHKKSIFINEFEEMISILAVTAMIAAAAMVNEHDFEGFDDTILFKLIGRATMPQ